MENYVCKFVCKNEKESWEGIIRTEKNFGSHYYLNISAKGSGISLYFGQAYLDTWFVCIPDWNAGITIGQLYNVHYNSEKIGVAMGNEIDGVTVAYALQHYAKINNIREIDHTAEIMDMFNKAGYERVEE